MSSLNTAGRRPLKRIVLLAAAFLALPAAAELLYRGCWAARSWLERDSDDKSFVLYSVGESTAAGEPYAPEITPAALVAGMFGGRIGGRGIRAVTVARSGESIYAQYAAFERALRFRGRGPGAVFIYSAHNDATLKRGIPPFERLREKFLSRSMLLRDLLFFAEKHLPVLRARTLDTYAHYLRGVVELSLEHGLTPILSTAVSDISGIDPGLFPGEGLTLEEIRAMLKKGLELEAGKRWREAVAYYAGRDGAHPRMRAYLRYRMARCLQAAGRHKEALRYYQEAVELPVWDNFGRARTAQNELIRGLAAGYRLPLADAAEIFSQRSPHGITDGYLFIDGHHPNMRGYLLLAGGFAGRLSAVVKEPLRRNYSGPGEVFREFSCGAKCQASAFIASGRWLFTSAALHARPEERLGLARARFESALAADPGNFSALLGLGLAEAASRSDLLSQKEGIDWLAQHRLYYGGDYRVADEQLDDVIEKLSACGVPEKLLERLSAAGTIRPPARADRR